jgi:hypothetical protein
VADRSANHTGGRGSASREALPALGRRCRALWWRGACTHSNILTIILIVINISFFLFLFASLLIISVSFSHHHHHLTHHLLRIIIPNIVTSSSPAFRSTGERVGGEQLIFSFV